MDSTTSLKAAIIACCFVYCFADTNIVGSTRVLLDGDTIKCRTGECNLGNLIADAMIDYNARVYEGNGGWTDAAIAMHDSGSVNASIAKSPKNEITKGDVLAVLPFDDEIVKVDLSGRVIVQMLEHSVYYLNNDDTCELRRAFLHFSGLQVDYDLSKPSGSRVHSVFILCADCRVPKYKKLEVDGIYKVLTTDFIVSGGEGFTMLKGLTPTVMGVTTSQAVIKYLAERSFVHPEIGWRITFSNSKISENIDKCKIEETRPKIITKKGNSGEKILHGVISLVIPSIIALFLTI